MEALAGIEAHPLFEHTRAERPCGGQDGERERTRLPGVSGRKWCCGFQNNSVESKVGLQKC